jgi:hypothetical protein
MLYETESLGLRYFMELRALKFTQLRPLHLATRVRSLHDSSLEGAEDCKPRKKATSLPSVQNEMRTPIFKLQDTCRPFRVRCYPDRFLHQDIGNGWIKTRPLHW